MVQIGGKKQKVISKMPAKKAKSETPQPKKSGKPEMFKSTPKSEPTKKKQLKKQPESDDDLSDLSTEDFEALLNGPGNQKTPSVTNTPTSNKKNSQEKKSKKNSSPPKLVPLTPASTPVSQSKTKSPKSSSVGKDSKSQMNTPSGGSASKKEKKTPNTGTGKKKRAWEDSSSEDDVVDELEINAKKRKLVKIGEDEAAKPAVVIAEKKTVKSVQKVLKRKLDEDSDNDVENVEPPKATRKDDAANKKRKTETKTATKEESETKTAAKEETPLSQKLTATDIANELKIKAEADKRTLFMKNLSRDVTVEQIKSLSKDILEARLRTIFAKKVDNKKSYAYIIFKDEKTADANFKSLAGKKIGKDAIEVDYVGGKSKKPLKSKEISADELDTRRLYIRGFNNSTMTEETLKKLFPKSVEVTLPHRKTGNVPIGYAFVRFTDESSCKRSHDEMQGKVVDGRTLVVLFAKLLSDRKVQSDLVKSKPAATKSKSDAAGRKKPETTEVDSEDNDDDDDEIDDDDEEDDEDDDD